MHSGAMEITQAKDHGGGNVGDVGGGYGDVTSRAIGEIGSDDGGLSEIACGDIARIDDLGGTSQNGPMVLEPPCPMANTTQGRIDDNHGVPPFLIKLYLMVDDQATHSIISWGRLAQPSSYPMNNDLSRRFSLTTLRRFISQILNSITI
ncbi:hypothetical protein L1987_83287 [Smallanthus sonchifolius]|uniref:Uncharacterized protein n=1 Tax=Smallanthus sonchifolius TaxID=185202 RepID=A0ACB8YC27_9ASTR|nr:hypothetical protein L1987_83287 [Smallanthus sonchifolius]